MTKKEISNVKRDIETSTGFQYKMKLFSIINRWEKGDFSQTVEEHNFLWNLEGGDTGKATERLSPEEEKQYIKEMKSK